jgi:hypothetical protein
MLHTSSSSSSWWDFDSPDSPPAAFLPSCMTQGKLSVSVLLNVRLTTQFSKLSAIKNMQFKNGKHDRYSAGE